MRLANGPVVIWEADETLAPDPLTCLLEVAYRRVAAGISPPDTGLLIAGDGSRVGQERVFRLALRRGGKIPPRLLPFRLSNGPASHLAIAHGHTGRVVTIASGADSLPQALRFARASLDGGVGPRAWIVLAGDVRDHGHLVRGWAWGALLEASRSA